MAPRRGRDGPSGPGRQVPQEPSATTIAVTEALRSLAARPPAEAALAEALRLLAKWRAGLVANTLAVQSGGTVQSGPFAGMAYPVRAAEGARAARLLGSYEAALHPVIHAAIARGYAQVVDVGCAEGYYAVGMALRLPQARILAFDKNAEARALCRALAEANGVADRVTVGGRIGHDGLALCAAAETLVICDIEGAEEALLDPAKAPGLVRADILVEAHDCFRPGLSDRLAARFAATHHVARIGRAVEGRALPPWMERLSDLDRLLALWEWRVGPTPWLWMKRR